MIGGIIVSHKDAGHAVLQAVTCMYGEVAGLASVSNEGLDTGELAGRIGEVAAAFESEGVCVFVDAYGGSCWRAARLATVPNGRVITGFNLPMLLSFVTKRDTVPFDDLPGVLEADAKRGIRIEECGAGGTGNADCACENR